MTYLLSSRALAMALSTAPKCGFRTPSCASTPAHLPFPGPYIGSVADNKLQDDISLSFRDVSYPHNPLFRFLCAETQLAFHPRHVSFREKLWLVFRATRTHARNLAKFAAIYKTACFLLKTYGATPGKEGTKRTIIPAGDLLPYPN